ncbi:hypothetical protein HanXRQr2_Chr02g0065671 [Helianthus annuus]|uniref:Uncharacterized protein n=1 Tax=Helianthus annuus TaxID=4232 RepID=A0A9K3JNS0_HELAN|nr:hypothetical protein HanXRQr2_Chr02g0065671 [Helianthus annuus]KAJ0618755.1 hypothetical protein HanHA89_Chr02g0057201 [Helianthus annuus]
MTLNLGNIGLLVDGGVISKLLGIRDSGSNFADVEEARTLHPSLKEWRARFPPSSYIAPLLISAAIQDDKYEDMAQFRTDFALLFLTTMASSQQNGYVKDRVLKRLTAETRYEDFNWCAFIRRLFKKMYEKMEAIGPKVLQGGAVDHPDGEHLLYVDCTRQPSCNTGDGIRAIHYWTKQLLTRRQDYELSNGGFSRGQGKTLSDGLSGEHV